MYLTVHVAAEEDAIQFHDDGSTPVGERLAPEEPNRLKYGAIGDGEVEAGRVEPAKQGPVVEVVDDVEALVEEGDIEGLERDDGYVAVDARGGKDEVAGDVGGRRLGEIEREDLDLGEGEERINSGCSLVLGEGKERKIQRRGKKGGQQGHELTFVPSLSQNNSFNPSGDVITTSPP